MAQFFDSIVTAGAGITLRSYLIALGFSLVCGLIVLLATAFRGNITKSFAVTVLLLPAIVQTVIMMVNGNVGTGIAVAGAFSLVRFRSVPGKAREIAAGFLGVGKGRVYALEAGAGDIPCYCFGADEAGGASAYVSVTKRGGRVLSLLSSRPVGSAAVDVDTARSTAARFLERCGYENMAETYHMTQGGVLTVNYAYRQGEVLCYSDLVKVSVALDTGRVCGLEARGWITAHTQRELPAPAVTADAARAAVPEGLEILAEQLALVPSDGKYETLCHEFKCQTADGRHYIIYVDALSGAQHKILILLEDASGALTI